MANLYGIGLTGLGAAQTALSTTSNNISNVNTPGYSRQIAQLDQVTSSNSQGGVKVNGVERQYQQYLTGQLNEAQSRSSELDTHLGQITQINNLLGDSDAGLAPLMQQFFAGLQTLAADPSDSAARESLLGDANSMAAQFRAFSQYLGDMQGSVTEQMDGAVGQINNYAEQISGLNKQITLTQAKTGEPPNNLLDQRDQLVSEMGNLVDVKLTVQDGSQYNIVVAGQSMVDASGAHSLTLTPSKDDASHQVVAYKTGSGTLRELQEKDVHGGVLGGLVAFRKESLEPARQRLDQLAHTLAARVNSVHQEGEDLSGQAGGEFFSVADPVSFSASTNAGNAALDVSFVDDESAKVAASDYQVVYSASPAQYEVTRLSDGNKTTFAGTDVPFSVGGLSVDVGGAPQDGDTFTIKPLSNAASNLEVEIQNTSKIAASQGGGTGDNSNALALADLQNESAVNGDSSFNSAYAQMTSDIGNQTRSLQVNSSAQQTLTSELQSAQQSVSGVNLDEERVNLLYYQQMYQANAKVIQTASTLFDTLLAIRG